MTNNERLLPGYSFYRPRLDTDKLFLLSGGSFSYTGPLDRAARFIEENQLLDAALWSRFAGQFEFASDDHNLGWRCEFWGKMMRGGCITYAYTQNPRLYDTLEATVRDLLNTQDHLGRISSYSPQAEFQGWDIWGRKYVLLGLEHFYDICADEQLKTGITAAMTRQLDYIIDHIGPAQGKKDIRDTSNFWEGMNSSSLLEPVVRLYNLTAEQRYLDFAGYIVNQGGIKSDNIFRLALEDRLNPYQYPVTKAYEMMSCFEGLLEYARTTGQNDWAQAAVNFGRRVMASDITVIGSAGCTHELFDHSRLRQVDPEFTGIMQETCVTVTWIKLCCQLLLYTGCAAFADEIERSAYNGLLGAVNYQKAPTDALAPGGWLPFDSYSPLRPGQRGLQVGGRMELSDGTIYGCCAAIGAAGTGLIPCLSAFHSKAGAVISLYLPGKMELTTPGGQHLRVSVATDYPRDGQVLLRLGLDSPESFELSLRIPGWCPQAQVLVNGQPSQAAPGWLRLERTWQTGDEISLCFSLPIILTPSRDISKEAHALPSYQCLRRGPIVLARDELLGGPPIDEPLKIQASPDGEVSASPVPTDALPIAAYEAFDIPLQGAAPVRVIDYASAGKDLRHKMAAWIPE